MVFPQPGGEGSPITIKSRYDNFIGGEWVAPVNGLYFENPSPVNGKTFCEVARGTAADIELALDAAHAAKDAWGRTSPAERSGVLLQIAQRHRGQPRGAGGRRGWENGKAVRETPRRRPPAGRRPLPLLRRRAPRRGGLDHPDRRDHGGVPLQRAARRRRPDHPVELPDPDGHLEARPRTGRRQLRRAEAGRADTDVDPAPDGDDRRPPARRRAQRRQRLRRRGRQAAGVEPARGQGRLHRRDHDRSADHAVRVGEPEPGHPGARRQERRTSSWPT